MTNVLSLGMGVQSTAIYLMSSLGELPRLDFAVFADTGREKLREWRLDLGLWFIIVVFEHEAEPNYPF
jgi:hypothetical protein